MIPVLRRLLGRHGPRVKPGEVHILGVRHDCQPPTGGRPLLQTGPEGAIAATILDYNRIHEIDLHWRCRACHQLWLITINPGTSLTVTARVGTSDWEWWT